MGFCYQFDVKFCDLCVVVAASAFGEQRRLEPMAADRKARWRREIGWLISVADHIVEFAPTQQTNKDGSSMEVMTTRQRTDLLCNIPALKKLDAMLLVRTTTTAQIY